MQWCKPHKTETSLLALAARIASQSNPIQSLTSLRGIRGPRLIQDRREITKSGADSWLRPTKIISIKLENFKMPNFNGMMHSVFILFITIYIGIFGTSNKKKEE